MSKDEPIAGIGLPRSALATHWHPGRHGAADGNAVTISEVRLGIVQVAARMGREGDLAAMLASVTGLDLPAPGLTCTARDLTAIWIAPAAWLVTQPWRAEPDLAQVLGAACGKAAAIVDLTFAKSVLRIAGPHARRILAKGCRVDLHPSAFGLGSRGKARAAATTIARIDTLVVQVDETPTFDLMVGATYAATFLEWLTMSAADTGCIIAG